MLQSLLAHPVFVSENVMCNLSSILSNKFILSVTGVVANSFQLNLMSCLAPSTLAYLYDTITNVYIFII